MIKLVRIFRVGRNGRSRIKGGNLFERIAQMNSSMALLVFDCILETADPVHKLWNSHQANRDFISNRLNIGDVSVKTYIKQLYDHGFLVRPEGIKRGVYKINEQLLNITLV